MDVKQRGNLAPSLKPAKTRSPQRVAKRFPSALATDIANEQRMAALCLLRASKWADAIREGLDPDIARFIRDQAAAWRLMAASSTLSAAHALSREL
jgi:hypothetical protein